MTVGALLFILLVGVALPCAAQDASSTSDVRGDDADEARPTALAPGVIDEVVVTARRRDEAAQDVPVALSVHSGAKLEAIGAWSLERMQRLDPSMHVFAYNPRATNISIRGLGGTVGLVSDGLEGGVGVFLDDVYLGRVGPVMFELVDLERVEVLRGPQSTLFGRNTTAGVVSLVTRPPAFDDAESIVEASVGDYGFRQAKASFSGPLVGDTLAGRFSFSDTERDGFIENVRTGELLHDFDNLTLRGQLILAPAPDLELRLIGDYAEQEAACCTNVGIGAFAEFDDGTPNPDSFFARTERLGYEPLPFVPFARKVDIDAPLRADMDQWGASLHVDWTLDEAELASITAYREWNWNPRNDFDYTGLPAITVAQTSNQQDQFSQEFRITSRGERRIDYVAGFYHYEEVIDGFSSFALGPVASQWNFPPDAPFARATIEAAVNGFATASTSTAETRSDSLFGQVVWHVNDSLDLTAGVRFSSERRSSTFELQHVAGADLSELPPEEAAIAQSIRNNLNAETAYASRIEDDAISGMLTLSYLTRFGTSYATAALGNKSGGLNVSNLPPGADPVVGPETVRHYEVGTKNRLFGDTTILNVAVFRTAISDYQTSVVEQNPSGGRPFEYLSNVGEVVSQGFEVEAAWSASERLEASAGVAYADAEYVSYPDGPCPIESTPPPAQCDLGGQPLAGSPEVSWTLGVSGVETLDRGLRFYWRLDYSYQSEYFTQVSNSRHSQVGSYGLSNLAAGVRWDGDRWDLRLWARNLLDEDYFRLSNGLSTGLVIGIPGDPRTMGLTLGARF